MKVNRNYLLFISVLHTIKLSDQNCYTYYLFRNTTYPTDPPSLSFVFLPPFTLRWPPRSDPHLAAGQVHLQRLQCVVGVRKVAVHEGQAVELAERQQLHQRQAPREVRVVLDVQVQQVLQATNGGRQSAREQVALQVQLPQLCN